MSYYLQNKELNGIFKKAEYELLNGKKIKFKKCKGETNLFLKYLDYLLYLKITKI